MAHFMSFERFSDVRRELPPFVVQIGAMDGVAHDPIYPYLKDGDWRGLLVEPLTDMYAQLRTTYKDCTGRLRFANVAIADPESIDEQGQVRMVRPDPAKIADGTLPIWARGVATLADREAHNFMGHDAAKQYAVEETVTAVTLGALLLDHGVTHVDVLQIDVEGNDFRVLRQLDFDQYHPSVINMEYTNLPLEEMKATQELLAANGYAFVTHRHDLFATDESTLSRLVKPKEMQLYRQYIEAGDITDAAKLPYVVAMLGEAASQFAGIVLDDSSDTVRNLFRNEYSEARVRRKRPFVSIAMTSIARMSPYFRNRESLAAFLEAELPEQILAEHQKDIERVI